ncbi:winged helix DNA-binding protein [Martelella alba]|uniref:Winged helix DNA-binding protein n=1 Tax=Martelella alba TaxID=2590451 RepID=A0A506U3W8_9HYPH|nr:MarR family transcriptional regulator [Martelella alba]TPW27991.1 winged helix DNA-binding protein [Martelella alba]
MENRDIRHGMITPALLRNAMKAYGDLLTRSLGRAGYDDLPKGGALVIAGIAVRGRLPLRELIRELGLSKQSAGQLVDALVARGYLNRLTDERDRRRLNVTLTERGREAADVYHRVRKKTEAEIAARFGRTEYSMALQVLQAFSDLGGGMGQELAIVRPFAVASRESCRL